MNHLKIVWKTCCIAAIIVVAISFSPLVLATGKTDPELIGLPYGLWMSMLMSIILVLLTIVGTLVHPGKFNDE